MTDTTGAEIVGGTMHYPVREVVGVFANPDSLEAAVDALENVGFEREEISVLATDATVKKRIGHLYGSAAEAADDPHSVQTAFVPRDSRAEGEAAAISLPFGIGGLAGASSAAAAGGGLAAAIGATLLGGVIGGGLGALLAITVARRHAQRVHEELAKGGLVLWVAAADDAAEQQAMTVLQGCGAEAVHAHTIQRDWGVKDCPLHDAQPDPFLLEHDPGLE